MLDLLYTNGDLTVDENGDLQLCVDEYHDIIQTANNNIMMRFGHNKWHNQLGNKIFTMRIKASQHGIEEVAQECTDAIINGDTRVKEVSYMNVTVGERATCNVDYRLIVNIGDGELKEKIVGNVVVDAFNASEGNTITEDLTLSDYNADADFEFYKE